MDNSVRQEFGSVKLAAFNIFILSLAFCPVGVEGLLLLYKEEKTRMVEKTR